MRLDDVCHLVCMIICCLLCFLLPLVSTIRDKSFVRASDMSLFIIFVTVFPCRILCLCPTKKLPEVVPEESVAAEPEFVHVVIVNPGNDVKVSVCKT